MACDPIGMFQIEAEEKGRNQGSRPGGSWFSERGVTSLVATPVDDAEDVDDVAAPGLVAAVTRSAVATTDDAMIAGVEGRRRSGTREC